MIELVPPAVQTDLTLGQATRPGYLPLTDFIDEVMELFAQQPTPAEILVQRVAFLRHAEAEHRFDAAVATLNEFARRAREDQGWCGRWKGAECHLASPSPVRPFAGCILDGLWPASRDEETSQGNAARQTGMGSAPSIGIFTCGYGPGSSSLSW